MNAKSIGVGLYQHDVDQKKLAAALDAVVESVVNYVGVDVNTASAALLGYVAGISKRVAQAIIAHRDESGPFSSRAELKKVKGLGPKAFEQAAASSACRAAKTRWTIPPSTLKHMTRRSSCWNWPG